MVPDSVKDAEDRLVQSMELYRQRCDNLGTSLHSLRDKIEDERFFGDLATEVNIIQSVVSLLSVCQGQQAEEVVVGREEDMLIYSSTRVTACFPDSPFGPGMVPVEGHHA